jgi:CubicO group peptidase (beta-lactamase class C family)
MVTGSWNGSVESSGFSEVTPPEVTAREAPLPGTARELLRRIAQEQSRGRAPSLVAGLVRDGELVWSGGRGAEGPPSPDTQYRIGSLTKTFAAVLVLRLREQGLVGLGDPVGKWVGGLPADVSGLTLAQLLSHTGGLAAETPGPWWERTDGGLRPELSDVLAEPPESALRLPPGRAFHYSNPGYALLGGVVEAVRGEPWGDALRAEVLEPLGMRRTSLDPEPPHAAGRAVHPWADVLLPEPHTATGRMAPAGQLWSTVRDLARWARFLLEGDERVLERSVLEEMRRPVAPREGGEWGGGYGLGIQSMRSQDRMYFGHSGSMPGFRAALWCDAEERLAGIVLANATAETDTAGTAVDLVRIVAEREPRIPDAWRPLPADAVDDGVPALTGPWYWGPACLALRLRSEGEDGGGLPGGRLELAPMAGSGGRASRFRPGPGEDCWTGLDGYYAGERLRVVRAGDGSVDHLDLGSFVLTREPYPAAGPGAGVVPGGVAPEGWRGGA